MSCDAVAVRPARHRPWAASVLASAGLCALVAVLMSGPARSSGPASPTRLPVLRQAPWSARRFLATIPLPCRPGRERQE